MDISDAVHAASADPSQHVRQQAQAQLEALESSNPAEYFVTLAQALARDDLDPIKRQMVGIAIKNALDKKDKTRKNDAHKRWLSLDPAAKEEVKTRLTATFACEHAEARGAAAQAAAKVAAIDIPHGQWDSFVEDLCGTITDSGNAPATEASLKCLGYLCEDLQESGGLEDNSDSILNAVVGGMNNAAIEIKRAATSALKDALPYCTENIDRDEERNVIMEAILNCAVIEDTQLRENSFMCLAMIAENHYTHMGAYLEAIFPLTARAIEECGVEGGLDSEQRVGWQALEFWANLCEEESLRMEDEDEEYPSMNFMAEIAQHLCPLLLAALTKQEEDHTPDDFEIAQRAAVCLTWTSQCVRDGMPEIVGPFIMESIASEDWHARDAAIMAFGCLLEGPSTEVLGEMLVSGVEMMVGKLQDDSEIVRDSAAWALGKIAEHHGAVFSDEAVLGAYVHPVCGSLADVPRVAYQCCYALGELGEVWVGEEDFEESYPLSGEAYHFILTQLINASDRPDGDECELRTSAYESIAKIIDSSPADCAEANYELLPEVVKRLEQTFAMGLDAHQATTLQGALCGIVNNIVMKLQEKVQPLADATMTTLIKILDSKQATVVEEAIRCAGSIADGVGEHFMTYLEAFLPYLQQGLRNWAEKDVMRASIGATGDVCRALTINLAPHCESIVTLLMEALQSPDLDREVKPDIFGVLGDIAMAIQEHYAPFAEFTMAMLMQASLAPLDEDADEDEVDVVLALRTAVMEGTTGLIHGLKESEAGRAALLPILMNDNTSRHLVNFLRIVTEDEHSPDDLTKAACGVLGDLCVCLEDGIKPVLGEPFIEALCQKCSTSEDEGMAEIGEYTTQLITALVR